MKTTVRSYVKVPGIHNWPGCDIPEVLYLRDPHRHVFHIRANKTVTHDDRDVEIIKLGMDIERYLKDVYAPDRACDDTCVFGAMSCEMIARELVEKFELQSCEVLEDDENGATVYQ